MGRVLSVYHDIFLYPQEVPRPVFAVGSEMEFDSFEQPRHSHLKTQLILTLRGLVICEVAKGMWMVPPQCALWIPGGMEHRVRGVGVVTLSILFLQPDMARGMPKECCTISISPLLRELILAVANLPVLYDCEGAEGRLTQTMLDQLTIAPVESLHLPLPNDPRLRKIADAFVKNPADRATISDWARRIAVSERTLFRLIQRDMGMSFGRWRQQCHIIIALKRLGAGEAVQSVAFDLGYESTSAFITMFRKVLGKSPAKYLASRSPKISR
ncbi:helix-turn-helix transcriptional regulator [Gluconobacter sp. OJB]|uniref:AraC family transcriptional regulator n=1 Tax=Gluconobacter sp. OJB TaxID=3145196 RepID=UPI0031FA2841